MLVSPKIFYKKCYGKFAIAAVNVFTMEQVLGLFRAGHKANAPFIVQTSSKELCPPLYIDQHDRSRFQDIKAVFAIHLDHGIESHVFDAISANYNSVMIDAHDDFEKNVTRTQKVVHEAHKKNIFVEAELGVLSGVEDDISIDQKMASYTGPDQAESFVNQTKCDSLAVAVGTSHGAYKFSSGQRLQFGIFGEIQKNCQSIP